MGLLDHLWDDTVAGPRPDSSSSATAVHHPRPNPPPPVAVTRSITILRGAHRSAPDSPASSAPSSPASNPNSPLTPATPWGDWRKARRKAFAEAATVEPRTPTVYDWVVISSLDK